MFYHERPVAVDLVEESLPRKLRSIALLCFMYIRYYM